jgi:hypothetical protein
MNCDCGKCGGGKRAASIDWLFATLIAVAVIIILLTT